MGRAPCCDKANVKRGPWSPEEDAKLKSYIENHGTGGNWIALPPKIGLKRCGKSCRLRWLNYLRPNLKHGGFTLEEDNLICTLYVTIGSRWSIIAGQLPGRTDNDIKNYWNTRLKKKLMGRQRRQQRQTTINKQAQSYHPINDSLSLHNNNHNHLQLQQQIPPPTLDAAAYSTNSMPNNISVSPFNFSCNNLQTTLDDFQYTCDPTLSRVQDQQHLCAANSVMQQLGGDFRAFHDAMAPQQMDGLDTLFDTNCIVNPPSIPSPIMMFARGKRSTTGSSSSILPY